MGEYATTATPSSSHASFTPETSSASRYTSEYCTWFDANGTPRSRNFFAAAFTRRALKLLTPTASHRPRSYARQRPSRKASLK